MKMEQCIAKVQQFILHRLEHYFGQREDAPSLKDLNLDEKKDDFFSKRLQVGALKKEEELMLMIALIPHLDPELYVNLIKKFLPGGGDLPIFGAVKAKNHRGIIPTGETAQFILAGTDTSERLKVTRILKQSLLTDQGILVLERVPDGEPEMSGRLLISREYVDLLATGVKSSPAFGPDFPAQKIETQRAWDDLVLTDELKEQIDELKLWLQYNNQLMDEWGMQKKLNPGYQVLFYGPSGTGKTLTATLLGKYTGREVFRVDLSTIVSKYIGETEKNLEKLFSKADQRDWILFFDEADALFGKRTELQDAHDRYANQEVSYLLQRVENFNGLIILSSNYKSNIDEAFLRRFNALIKFPFPDAQQRKLIWEKSFPENVRFEKRLDIGKIAACYKLTGGSIINVVHYASLKAISEKTDVIMLKNVLHGIRRELEKEGKVFSPLTGQTITVNGMHGGTK